MRVRLNKEAIGDKFAKDDEVAYSGRFHYCGNCHTEFYFLWKIGRDVGYYKISCYDEIAEEYLKAYNTVECPFCGEKLIMEPGYFCSCDAHNNIFSSKDQIGLKKYQKNISKYAAERYCVVESCFNGVKNLEFTIEDFKDDPKKHLHVYKYQMDKYFDLDKIYAEMAEIREPNIFSKELEMLKIKEDIVVPSVKSQFAEEIKANPEKLREYIQHLITLEIDIMETSKRLLELYKMRIWAKDGIISEPYVKRKTVLDKITEKQDKVQSARNELQVMYEELERLKNKKEKTFKKKEYPPAPQPPVLKAPGLFNKNRVLEENQRLEENYNKALKKYEHECRAIDERNEGLANSIQQQREKNFSEQLERIKRKEEELNIAINQADECEKENAEIVQTIMNAPTTYHTKLEMIENEIGQAESILSRSYECRNKLYSYGIVFDKYRNVVALSTFYEYLMTERTTSLVGANGAYNIYEQECRMDLIISQLSDVLESLEQIKKNQYMLYSKLNEISSHLESLSFMMSSALTSLDSIERTASITAENTSIIKENTEVIAYNTAVTAYYSQKNAELTNAMGYLIAFNS